MEARSLIPVLLAAASVTFMSVIAQGCAQGIDCAANAGCSDPDGATGGGESPLGNDASRSPDVLWAAFPDARDEAQDPMDSGAPIDAAYDVAFDAYVLPDTGSSNDAACPSGPGENCSNGVDDNCDGLADCADPLCSGFTCDDAPPSGWQGPIELYLGSGNTLPTPPACAAPYANDFVDGYSGLNAQSAQCGCGCGNVGGADCDSSIDWTVYTDANCTTADACSSGAMPSGAGAFCESTTGCSVGSFKVTAGAPLLNIASCQANPSKSVQPYGWQQVARGCGYSGPVDHGGCSSGGMCVQRPSSPFDARACIYQAGDVPCPGGSYSVKQTFYAAAADSRDCTACTCGSPAGVTCSLSGSLSTYSTFGSPTCSNVTGTSGTVGACATVTGGAAGIQGYVTTTPTGGSCPPNPVNAIGSVNPTGPTTVCCVP